MRNFRRCIEAGRVPEDWKIVCITKKEIKVYIQIILEYSECTVKRVW